MDTFVFVTSITTAKIEDAPELITSDEHAHFPMQDDQQN